MMETWPQSLAGYRFGGHQSFALRYAWLPKVVEAIEAGDDVLTDPLEGVVRLGLGKNMVEALRCWVEAYGVARRRDGWELTPDGEAIFGSKGEDPFIEDAQSLWWLHWTIATGPAGRFFAWELLVNRWSETTFTASQIVTNFLDEADRAGRRLSPVSARQHFDVWLHTYLAGGAGRGEDGLDSPLASLRMLTVAGDREMSGGRREPVYAFDRLPRRNLGQGMFRYALSDWWDIRNTEEETASLAEVAFGRGAPGQVFRLSEQETFARVEDLARREDGGFELRDGSVQTLIRRRSVLRRRELIPAIFAWRDAPTSVTANA